MIRVREALPEDLPAVLALDREFSPVYAGTGSYAALLGDAGLLLVIPDDGRGAENALEGFLAVRCVLDEADVINIAVTVAARRRGHGASLLEDGIRRLGARGIRRLQLDVRESNAAARALYPRCGFREDGRRPAYYPSARAAGGSGERESAVLMSRDLPQRVGVAS